MAAESISKSVLQSNGLADDEADFVLNLLQDRNSQQQVEFAANPLFSDIDSAIADHEISLLPAMHLTMTWGMYIQAWQQVTTQVLKPSHPFPLHQLLFREIYQGWDRFSQASNLCGITCSCMCSQADCSELLAISFFHSVYCHSYVFWLCPKPTGGILKLRILSLMMLALLCSLWKKPLSCLAGILSTKKIDLQGPCPVWIPPSQSIQKTNLAKLMATFKVFEPSNLTSYSKVNT